MQLPRAKADKPLSSILPKRREALDDPNSAWDLLDELHRMPGMYGSAVSTRAGKIPLSDTSDETKREAIEALARDLADDFRETVTQLGLGPLRLATVQSGNMTLSAAPIGPGMLVTVADVDRISLVELRHRLSAIQDELGRVEVLDTLSGRRKPAAPASAKRSAANTTTAEREEVSPMAPLHGSGGDALVLDTDEEVVVTVSDVEAPSEVALDEMQSAEVVDERGVVMVFVPGGTYRQGSTDGPDEQPVHEVTVNPFLIDKYPVTNEAYDAFLDESPLWRPGAKNTLLLDDDYLAAWGAQQDHATAAGATPGGVDHLVAGGEGILCVARRQAPHGIGMGVRRSWYGQPCLPVGQPVAFAEVQPLPYGSALDKSGWGIPRRQEPVRRDGHVGERLGVVHGLVFPRLLRSESERQSHGPKVRPCTVDPRREPVQPRELCQADQTSLFPTTQVGPEYRVPGGKAAVTGDTSRSAACFGHSSTEQQGGVR